MWLSGHTGTHRAGHLRPASPLNINNDVWKKRDSVDAAAARITQILQTPGLRDRLGMQARETVRRNFLMSRLAEDWIDLLTEFSRS